MSVEDVRHVLDGAVRLTPPPEGAAPVATAANATTRPGRRSRAGSRRNTSESLLAFLGEMELWHAPNKVAYASVPVGPDWHNLQIDSEEFRRWLTHRAYTADRRSPPRSVLDDVVRLLAARAIFDGRCHDIWRRVGSSGDGCIWLDLGEEAWRAVRIGPDGWDLYDKAPIKFVRTYGMQPLLPPRRGGDLTPLRQFLPVADEDDFRLVVGWLVAALKPRGPYPILALTGEQGAGKSVATRVLRSLIDPNLCTCRSMPKDEADLYIAALNAWVASFDNLSGIRGDLSDALCRLATGGGYATRKKYSDTDEVILDVQRPVLLNGIPDLAGRPDLGDRMLSVRLTPMAPDRREPEAALWAAFDAVAPCLLGALCDAVAIALRRWPEVLADRPADLPRLADAALWVEAAGPALGWEPGGFLAAHQKNRAAAAADALADHDFAAAVARFVRRQGRWEGSAGQLLAALQGEVADSARRSRDWPQSARAAGIALSRYAALLRDVAGMDVDKRRTNTPNRDRLWVLSVRKTAS